MDWTSAILAHCWSSVSLLPSWVEAKPHWVAVERNVLGGFLDAGLDGVRILKVGLLGGDQAEHDLLVAGDFGERREIAGTVVVELEVVGVHVLLAEQFGRDRRVASGGKPGGVEVAAAHVGVDDQVVRLVGDHGVDDVEVLLLQA